MFNKRKYVHYSYVVSDSKGHSAEGDSFASGTKLTYSYIRKCALDNVKKIAPEFDWQNVTVISLSEISKRLYDTLTSKMNIGDEH